MSSYQLKKYGATEFDHDLDNIDQGHAHDFIRFNRLWMGVNETQVYFATIIVTSLCIVIHTCTSCPCRCFKSYLS